MNYQTVKWTAGILLAGVLGVLASACHADKKCAQKNSKLECNCPMLMLVEDSEEFFPDGPFPECPVCTVWSEQYQPCSAASAACPAVAAKPLGKAPLCEPCKKKIRECAKLRQDCPVCGKDKTACVACVKKLNKKRVKHLVTQESMRANMNCSECAETAKKAARLNAMKMGRAANQADGKAVCPMTGGDSAACPMTGGKAVKPAACCGGKSPDCPSKKKPAGHKHDGAPATTAPANQPNGGVLIIEEGEITVDPATPAPDTKKQPDTKKTTPAPAKQPNSAAYPIPAPPPQAPQPVIQPQGPTAFPMAGAEF